MTWAKPTSRKPEIARQRRQTADRTRGVPTVGTFVHGAAAELDHGWSRGGVRPGERDDLACRKACSYCAPHGGEREDVPRQFLKARSVRPDKRGVVKLFRDDNVHNS
jgi:hypothetical protein